jgi:hypothetical protein
MIRSIHIVASAYKRLTLFSAAFLALALSISAQTIVNPSFELDTFAQSPGYIGGLNGSVTGWSGPAGFGLNPADGQHPFADNGTIPDGSQVAFIQDNGTMSQTITGFVVGAEYVLKYWENARSGNTPGLTVTIGGTGLSSSVIVPGHLVSSGQYIEVTSNPFQPVSPVMTLGFVKSTPITGDHTVLIDHVRLVQTRKLATPTVNPCEASGRLLVADSFDYPAGMNLNDVTPGGIGWAGGYIQEHYDASIFTNLGPLVVSGGMTHGPLLTAGNKIDLNDRRAQRNIDLSAIPADLKSESPTNGTVVRATGKSIWLSVLAHQTDPSNTGFFGTSLFRDNTEILFIGKAGGTAADRIVWKLEGKFPNTTGLTTNPPTQQSLLVVRIDWNDDGSRTELYSTNLATGVITTNVVPTNPDVAYMWVNPDPNSPSLTPETATASALSIRNATARNDFLYSFNRVGFRGQNPNAGMLDEFRIGTTYRAVVPTARNQFDLCANRSGNNTVVQWRTTPNVVLRFTTDLNSNSWSNVTEPLQTNGDRTFVNLLDPSGQRFYRLEPEF